MLSSFFLRYGVESTLSIDKTRKFLRELRELASDYVVLGQPSLRPNSSIDMLFIIGDAIMLLSVSSNDDSITLDIRNQEIDTPREVPVPKTGEIIDVIYECNEIVCEEKYVYRYVSIYGTIGIVLDTERGWISETVRKLMSLLMRYGFTIDGRMLLRPM